MDNEKNSYTYWSRYYNDKLNINFKQVTFEEYQHTYRWLGSEYTDKQPTDTPAPLSEQKQGGETYSTGDWVKIPNNMVSLNTQTEAKVIHVSNKEPKYGVEFKKSHAVIYLHSSIVEQSQQTAKQIEELKSQSIEKSISILEKDKQIDQYKARIGELEAENENYKKAYIEINRLWNINGKHTEQGLFQAMQVFVKLNLPVPNSI